MPSTVTVNTLAECLRTDCSILGENEKNTDNFSEWKPVCFSNGCGVCFRCNV